MSKIKFGVIGIGVMGSYHASYLSEGQIADAELTAVCDVKQNRLDWAKSAYGASVATYLNAEDLINSGVDAVIISTPHFFHPVYAEIALNRGLNVLCEKPAGVCVKQLEKVNTAAKNSNRAYAIMHQLRTSPLYIKANELVKNGSVGDIQRINWIVTNWFRDQAYYDFGNWRATWAGEGGGVLMNQCSHNLDLWQWICGMPSSVMAFCLFGRHHNIEVEDDVTAYMEYKNGATGVFITSTADKPGTNRLEITGDKGKLMIEDSKLSFWKLNTSTKPFLRDSSVKGAIKCEYFEFENADIAEHQAITQNFVANILRGEPLIAPGVDGMNSTALCNAMYLSSWTNRKISFPINSDEVWSEFQKRITSSSHKNTESNFHRDSAKEFNGLSTEKKSYMK